MIGEKSLFLKKTEKKHQKKITRIFTADSYYGRASGQG
jgi:hypothetical protein